jgi:hypothetical protein
MDTSLMVAAGASFVAGLLGYIIARLWIKPIVRYTVTRRKLDRALACCLATFNDGAARPGGKQEPPNGDDAKTLRMARKHAMDLVSSYGGDIPYWYRLLLDSRKESPADASMLLGNLSKIRDPETVRIRIDRARRAMGLK